MAPPFSPDELLALYRRGVFPMANDADDPDLFLVNPERRGIIPVSPFRIPARMRRTLRSDPFRVSVDEAFPAVMRACAQATSDRPSTWINDDILEMYGALHARGDAHSVECWRGEELVGGLYGVSLKGAFFGESMFSRATDASKIALIYLAARLQVGGYRLLDAQFYTPHLSQFGCIEIGRAAFRRVLEQALSVDGDFYALDPALTGDQLLQSIAHTS